MLEAGSALNPLAAAEQLQRGFTRLRFDNPHLEARFRRDFFAARTDMVRLGLYVGVVLYTLYLLARLHQPASTLLMQTTGLRAVIILSMLAGAVFYEQLQLRTRPLLMAAIYIVFTVCITAIEVLTVRAGVEAHYEGMMFIVFHVFLFSGYIYWSALRMAMVLVTLYALCMLWSPLLGETLAFQLFFLLLTASLGGGAQFLVEKSEREAWLKQRELEYLANTDSVTRLANRSAFERMAKARIREAAYRHEGICLVLVDIDHFKKVNDRYGHAVGDRVLRDIGRALSELSNEPGDVVARWGGDELAAIWHCCRRDMLAQRFEKLREQAHALSSVTLSNTQTEEFAVFSVSAGGVILVPEVGGRFEDFLRQADDQLYEAKRSGRDTWRLGDGGAAA